mgnify:CR=1 FL=1
MKYLILGNTKENIVEISLIYSVEPPKSVGEYIATNTIPEPTEKEGKRAVLYYNKETKEIFYKYVDVPKDKENELQNRVDALEKSNRSEEHTSELQSQ